MVRLGGWIQTYMGIQFYPLDPRMDEICIEDIAHALSNLCRFAGHCKEFYSVAEHSVRVAREVEKIALDKQEVLQALLHDGSEAYLVDMPRPLKHEPIFGLHYREAENRLQRVIYDRFRVPVGTARIVKEADDILLVTEQRDLMGDPPRQWSVEAKPLLETINPWSPSIAKEQFLNLFNTLNLRDK